MADKIYRYEIDNAGKKTWVDQADFDKNWKTYAAKQKGATIRMKDSDGEYDVPLSEYDAAKANGLKGWSRETVIANKKKSEAPKTATSMAKSMAKPQQNFVENSPMQPTDYLHTTVADRAEEQTYPGQEWGKNKVDELKKENTRRSQPAIKEHPYLSKTVGQVEDETKASANAMTKIYFAKPSTRNRFGQDYQSVLNNLEEQAGRMVSNAAGWGEAYEQGIQRQAAEVRSPENIQKQFENSFLNSYIGDFVKSKIGSIEHNAKKSGMTPERYAEAYIKQAIAERVSAMVQGKNIERYLPKDYLDYTIKNVLTSSVLGQLANVESKSGKQMMSQGVQMTNEGQNKHIDMSVNSDDWLKNATHFVGRVGAEAASFMADAPIMSATGVVGKGALNITSKVVSKYMPKLSWLVNTSASETAGRSIDNLVASNISRFTANEIAKHSARMATKGVISGSTNMGLFMGTQGAVTEAVQGDNSMSSVGLAFLNGLGKGASMGAGMGVAAPVGLVRGMATKPLAKVGATALGLGTEFGTMAGFNMAEAKLAGQWQDETFVNSLVEAGSMVLAGKVQHATMHPKEFVSSVANMFSTTKGKSMLTKQEISQLLEGTNENSLLSALYNESHSGKKIEINAGELSKEIGGIIADESKPFDARAKLSAALYGMVPSRPMYDSFSVEGNNITLRDKNGNPISVKEYHDGDELTSIINNEVLNRDIDEARNYYGAISLQLSLNNQAGGELPVDYYDAARYTFAQNYRGKDGLYHVGDRTLTRDEIFSMMEPGGELADTFLAETKKDEFNPANGIIFSVADEMGVSAEDVVKAMAKPAHKLNQSEIDTLHLFADRCREMNEKSAETENAPEVFAEKGKHEAINTNFADDNVPDEQKYDAVNSVYGSVSEARNRYAKATEELVKAIEGDATGMFEGVTPDKVTPEFIMQLDETASPKVRDAMQELVSAQNVLVNAEARKQAFIAKQGQNIEEALQVMYSQISYKDGGADNVVSFVDGDGRQWFLRSGMLDEQGRLAGDMVTFVDTNGEVKFGKAEDYNDVQMVMQGKDEYLNPVREAVQQAVDAQFGLSQREAELNQPQAEANRDNQSQVKETENVSAEDKNAENDEANAPENLQNPEENSNFAEQSVTNETPTEEPQQTVEFPKDKNGKDDYLAEGVTPESALARFREKGLDDTEIADLMDAKLKKSKAPKMSDDEDKYLAAKAKYAREQEIYGGVKAQLEAEKKAATEQAIVEEQARLQEEAQRRAEAEAARQERERIAAEARTQEEERIRKEKEKLAGVPDWLNDKPEDARERGFRMVEGVRYDRQEPIEGVEGRDAEVIFGRGKDDTKQGKMMLASINDVQESHRGDMPNPLHFIPEAQPKDRTSDASKADTRVNANPANFKPELLTGDGVVYTESNPVVNARGEVIQGNGRLMTMREVYNNPESAKMYKDYLKAHAEEFGLKAEDIDKIDKPILVNRLDVDDKEAIRLGQFTASDMESGGEARIKSQNTVKKMGDKFKDFTRQLFETESEDASVSELIDKNGIKVLKWMNHLGFISNSEYDYATRGGKLTAEGKNDINNILKQRLFEGEPDMLRTMFDNLPAKAQKAILANYLRDLNVPEEAQLLGDIRQTISAYNDLMSVEQFAGAKEDYAKAKAGISDWLLQKDAFSSVENKDKYSPVALELAARLRTATQKGMSKIFDDIYSLLGEDKGAHMNDMFSEAPKEILTKAEAYKRLFNIDTTKDDNKLQGRDNVAGDSEPGTEGERGRSEVPQSGERAESGERSADSGRRTEPVGGEGEANVEKPESINDRVQMRVAWKGDYAVKDVKDDAPKTRKFGDDVRELYQAKVGDTTYAGWKVVRKNEKLGFTYAEHGNNSVIFRRFPDLSKAEALRSGDGLSLFFYKKLSLDEANRMAQFIENHRDVFDDPKILREHKDDVIREIDNVLHTEPKGEEPKTVTEQAEEPKADTHIITDEEAKDVTTGERVAVQKNLDLKHKNSGKYILSNIEHSIKYWKKAISAAGASKAKILEGKKTIAMFEEELAKREAYAKEHGIENKTMTVDETEALFNQFNSDADIAKLAEKVFAIARKFNPTIKMTRQLKGGSDGNCGVEDGIVKYNYGRYATEGMGDQRKASVIVHELIHSATNYALHAYELHQRGKDAGWNKLTKGQQDAVLDLVNIYGKIKNSTKAEFPDTKNTTKNGKAYGLSDVYEMAAEMATPAFRAQLKAKRLWKKFKDAIKQFFNFGEEGAEETNAFDEVNKALDYLLENPNEEVYKFYNNTGRGRTRDAISNSFIGERGATDEEREALDVAEQMEMGGKDELSIKVATGWERGADGKWRYETPDVKADFSKFDNKDEVTLSELVGEDDPIFKSYPDMKNTKVVLSRVKGELGSYNDKTNTIELNRDNIHDDFEKESLEMAKKAVAQLRETGKMDADCQEWYMTTNDELQDQGKRQKFIDGLQGDIDNGIDYSISQSTLIHEIQHAIQHIEGFARGGNYETRRAETVRDEINSFIDKYGDDWQNKFDDADIRRKELSPLASLYLGAFDMQKGDISAEEAKNEINNSKDNILNRHSTVGEEGYRRLGGEVESRNVQKRADMSEEERRHTLAVDTEDVARDKQIIGADDNGVSASIITDKKKIEELEKQPKKKAYHSMQLLEIDGKKYLYPPMAAVQDGKFVEGIPVNEDGTITPTWEQADENPHLAYRKQSGKNGKKIPNNVELTKNDDGNYYYEGKKVAINDETGEPGWYFDLKKGSKGDNGRKNGDTNGVLYDPYQHSTTSPLNDQFTSAWNRSHLVTVEVEIPEGEIETPYKAEKAGLATGEHDWKGGTVAKNIKGDDARKVILSRYDKPLRIVPDSEVAEQIKGVFDRNGIKEMPFNVVTPSLRGELEKLGIKIGEPTEGAAGDAAREAYEVWKNGGKDQIHSGNFKKWFGDWDKNPVEASKVVDENGEPLIMHHTTNNNFTVFDKNKIGSGQGQAFLGIGFNFSKWGETIYGKNDIGAYLDIKHPMTSANVTLTRKQVRDIITELDGMSTEKIEQSWGTMDDCLDALLDSEGDLDIYSAIGMTYYGNGTDVMDVFSKRGFDGTIEYDNDGRIRNAVVFNPEQIKSATDNNGGFDRENPDIRFRTADEDESLVGMHNLSEENLRHALKMGGIANPSTAVVDMDKAGMADFGEITLLMPPSLIETRSGKNAGTWATDAYSPRYPMSSIVYDVKSKGQDILRKALDTDGSLGSTYQVIAYISSDGIRGLRKSLPVKVAFAKSIGEDAVVAAEGKYSKEVIDTVKKNACTEPDEYGRQYIEREKWSDEQIKKLGALHKSLWTKNVYNGKEDLWDRHIKRELKRYEDKEGADNWVKEANARDRRDIQKYGATRMELERFATAVMQDSSNAGKPDHYATQRKADEIINSHKEEFDKWSQDLYDKLNVEEKIFDGYTPAGSRKYKKHTLENISKMMKKAGREGGETLFSTYPGALRAKVSPVFKTLKQIRDAKDRLVAPKDFEDIKEQIHNEYWDLESLLEGDMSGDEGFYRLEEAMKHGAEWVNKKYDDIDLDKEDIDRINAFRQLMYEAPTEYFETKFERPVGLNEFKAAVVPDTLPADLEKALKDNGLSVYKYNPKKEGDRERVQNEASKEEDLRFRSSNQPFYSNADRAIDSIKQEKANGEQWLAMLKKNGGLKAEEDKWMGLSDWLKDKKSVTKAEIKQFIADNSVKIEEVKYSDAAPEGNFEYDYDKQGYRYNGEDDTYYTSNGYTFEVYVDGKNVGKAYNEQEARGIILNSKGISERRINDTRMLYTTYGLENKKEIALTVPTIEPYNAGGGIHFGDAGEGRAVAWVRFGETLDKDNNRVLVIDEIQSKRHQDGREKGYNLPYNPNAAKELRDFKSQLRSKYPEGYLTPSITAEIADLNRELLGNATMLTPEEQAEYIRLSNAYRDAMRQDLVPDAPFRKNWQELAMKRMLRYAAEHGYDKVAWTTGEQQNDRYNLGSIVNNMYSESNEDGTMHVTINTKDFEAQPITMDVDKDGKIVRNDMYLDNTGDMTGKNLSDIIGKDFAKKLINEETNIDGAVLKIGGEGMKGFYDKMLPNFIDKYGKKWGVKTQEVFLPDLPRPFDRTMHSVDITPEMKESVMQGQPMFRVHKGEDAVNDYGVKIAEKAQKVLDAMDNGGTVVRSEADLDERGRSAIKKNPKATGWYNTKTGKVTVYLPNCRSEHEVMRTIWHEKIGHEGMRKALGEEGYKKFYNNLWMAMTPEERNLVTGKAQRRGWDYNVAMDEHLAEMAEDFDHENNHYTLWQKIKDAFNLAVYKMTGHKASFTINDVRTAMWLSKHAQENKTGSIDYRLRKAAFEAKLRNVKYKEPTTADGWKWADEKSKPTEKDVAIAEKDKVLSDYLFRRMTDAERDQIKAGMTPEGRNDIEEYNKRFKKWRYAWSEAYGDRLKAARVLMETITGKEGNEIADPYNIVNNLEALASKNLQAQKKLDREQIKPLFDKVNGLQTYFDGKTADERYSNFEAYVYAKHALERNRYLAVKKAHDAMVVSGDDEKIAEADQMVKDFNDERARLKGLLDNGTITLREYYEGLDAEINKHFKYDASHMDMAGLSDVDSEVFKKLEFSTDTKGEYDEEAVMNYVMDSESKMGEKNTKDLWDSVNKLSKGNTEREYYAGLHSKKTKDMLDGMFYWYVPLRGFDEKTAEEQYGYFNNNALGAFQTNVHTSGRISMAETPIATLAAMSDYSILRSNRNEAKMALWRLAKDHNSNLLGEFTNWYEQRTENGETVLVPHYPDLEETDTPAMIHQKLEQFDKDAIDNGWLRLSDIKTNSPYRIVRKSDMAQHFVNVMIDGKQHTLVVHGNPRAAQAINGSVKDAHIPMWDDFNRMMSGLMTSYSYTFMMRNAFRDAEYAMSSGIVGDWKEGESWNRDFAKTYAGLVVGNVQNGEERGNGMLNLFRKYKSGELQKAIDDGRATQLDKYFAEFCDNGGMTGYTEMRSREYYEQEIKQNVNDMFKGKDKNKAVKVATMPAQGAKKLLSAWFGLAETLNEGVENHARFSAYVASRKQHRSISRAVHDAKEISVNFNRTGAGWGTKSLHTENMTTAEKANRNVAALTASYMRHMMWFFNPAVQGMSRTYDLMKGEGWSKGWLNKDAKHIGKINGQKGRFLATYVAMPMLTNLVCNMVSRQIAQGDTDDEKKKFGDDPYSQLPDFVRRDNACLYLGHGTFVMIPIDIEQRAMNGLADVIIRKVQGKKSENSLGAEIFEQFTQITPMDLGGGGKVGYKGMTGSVIGTVTPSNLQPIIAVATNIGWTGSPVSGQRDWNKSEAEWQRVLSTTSPVLTEGAKELSIATGGEKAGVRGGAIDINPAIVEYLASAYFGGPGKETSEFTTRMYEALSKDEKVDLTKLPVAKAFSRSARPENAMATDKARWYKYAGDYAEISDWLRGFKSHHEVVEYNALKNSKDGKIAKVVEHYKKRIKKMQEKKNDAKTPMEKEYAGYRINENISKAIQEIDRIENSK